MSGTDIVIADISLKDFSFDESIVIRYCLFVDYRRDIVIVRDTLYSF